MENKITTLPKPFNPQEHDILNGYADKLPVGEKIPVIIYDAYVEANKNNANDGKIVIRLKVIDGESVGATGMEYYNLYHSDPKTVKISESKFTALCLAIGFSDTVEQLPVLHDKPFRVDVQVDPKEPKYTRVSKVYDINGNEPRKGQQQTNNNNGFNNQSQQVENQNQPTQGFGGNPSGFGSGAPQNSNQTSFGNFGGNAQGFGGFGSK